MGSDSITGRLEAYFQGEVRVLAVSSGERPCCHVGDGQRLSLGQRTQKLDRVGKEDVKMSMIWDVRFPGLLVMVTQQALKFTNAA